MRSMLRFLNRNPLPIATLIVVGAIVAGFYAHDYVVNVVQPRQAAAELARIQGEIAEADAQFERRRYDRARKAYNYVIDAFADRLERLELGRLYHRAGLCSRLLAPRKNQVENLTRAAAAFEAALKLRPPGAVPEAHAATQLELGRTRAALALREGEGADIGQALAAYEAALEIYTRDAHPYEYATIQRLIGNAHRDAFVAGDGQQDALMAPGLAAYAEALDVFDPERYPKDYGETQIDLGEAHMKLARGIFVRRHTGKAVEAFTNAMLVFPQAKAPRDYGRVQKHLGDAYTLIYQRGAPTTATDRERMRHKYQYRRFAQRAYELAAQFGGRDVIGEGQAGK